jgi:hypothetical protein
MKTEEFYRKIRQRKDDCHYETSIEKPVQGGWVPVVIGYGFTQEEADKNALEQIRRGRI